MTETVPDQEAEIWLDRGARRYRPGETLNGSFRLAEWRGAGLQAVELSVLWYTSGQGEEDFHVHHFLRRREAALPPRADEKPHHFKTVLPACPLSYDGQIVKVCWEARLRGFFEAGRQRTVAAPFLLSLAEDGTDG